MWNGSHDAKTFQQNRNRNRKEANEEEPLLFYLLGKKNGPTPVPGMSELLNMYIKEAYLL